jgi:hypothetical protein
MSASDIPVPYLTVKKRLYTLAEVERASTFGRQALYKWHKAGRIEFVHVANRTFMTDVELERLVTGQIDLPDGHRARHWTEKPQPQPRRRGRPKKPRPEREPSVAAE